MSTLPTTICERCGTFSDLSLVGGVRLCSDCAKRVAEAARYWPSGYLIGIGCLLNPAAAAVLLVLNYRRLGDREQARKWTIASGLLLAFYVAILGFDLPIPSSVLLPIGIGGGMAIGGAWKQQWKELQARGAKRANVWLPPLLTVVAVVAVVVVSVLVRGDDLGE